MLLAADAGTTVPHPGFIADCEGLDVLGVVFYLMEEVDGFNPGSDMSEAYVRESNPNRQLLMLRKGVMHALIWAPPSHFAVDTPGVRQFDLWNVIPEHLDGHFREFRPFVAGCHFPGCSHLQEEGCAVRAALAEGWIDPQRRGGTRGSGRRGVPG